MFKHRNDEIRLHIAEGLVGICRKNSFCFIIHLLRLKAPLQLLKNEWKDLFGRWKGEVCISYASADKRKVDGEMKFTAFHGMLLCKFTCSFFWVYISEI